MRWIKQFLLRIGARGRKIVLGGGAAMILVAVICSFMLRGEEAKAVGTALRNPMSVFSGRSPGARLGGALYQTKPKVAAAQRRPTRPVGVVPRERVLSGERTRPTQPAAFADAPPLALLGEPGLMSGAPIDGPLANGPAFDVPGFGFGNTPGFTTSPGDETPGGGGGGGPDTDPGSGPSTGPGTGLGTGPGSGPGTGSGPGSAVPEIATWMMMIVGLGAVGQALRRQRVNGLASATRN